MPTIYHRARFDGGHASALLIATAACPPYGSRTDLLCPQAQSRTRLRQIGTTGKSVKNLSSPSRKNIPLSFSAQISGITPPVSRQMRGVGHRHERAVRCDGRESATRRARWKRTAKSCGSGAAVLALSPREAKLLAGDGGKRAVLREEHEVSRKAIAQGRPECSRCPVCSCAVLFAQIARETAGAASTRSSLRPLISKRANEDANLGRITPREREAVFSRHRGEAKRYPSLPARSSG